MIRKSTRPLVEELVGLLVEHFGADKVRAAVAKTIASSISGTEAQPHNRFHRPHLQAKPTVRSLLENLRQTDADKFHLLDGFYMQLKGSAVLRDSQDIRYFAQIVGLKEISGKSRKDMIPRLMRFLLDQPTERLRVDIAKAANISEQQRQKGFSVLTDKLLGEKPTKPE